MTFNELVDLMHKIGIHSLANIARELNASPQSVSNWKSRNQVPYKYVKILREKIDRIGNTNRLNIDNSIPYSVISERGQYARSSSFHQGDEISMVKLFNDLFNKISNNIKLFVSIPIDISILTIVHVQYFVEPV